MIRIGPKVAPAPEIPGRLGPAESLRVHLTRGEIVQAKVLESTSSSGSALLLIKGQRLPARTDLPLSAGSVVSLKVETAVPLPALKVLRATPADTGMICASRLLSAMKENIWKSLLEGLLHLNQVDKETIRLRSFLDCARLLSADSAEIIKRFVQGSGLSWESKLMGMLRQKHAGRPGFPELLQGDLKGLLSRHLSSSGGTESVPGRLVSVLEQFQLLNIHALEHDGGVFLPVPIRLTGGEPALAQLLIRFPKNEKGPNPQKDRPFRITFLLELTNLGPIRVDLGIRRRNLQGRFMLGNGRAKAVIEENLPLWIRKLRDRGFHVGRLGCVIRNPAEVIEPLIKEIISVEDHAFNRMA